MVKRTKDLFRLLEERERQAKRTGGRSAPRGVGQPSGASTAARSGEGGAPARPPREARRRPRPRELRLGGLGVAVVALVCLGGGFLLGRTLGTGPAPARELVKRAGPAPAAPGPLAAGAAGESVAAENEAEKLSNLFFEVLRFPAAHREQAATVAAYLRAQGVHTARIREFRLEDSEERVWVALAYVLGPEDAEAVLKSLQAVPPSEYPRLEASLKDLTLDKLLLLK